MNRKNFNIFSILTQKKNTYKNFEKDTNIYLIFVRVEDC